MDSPRLQFGIRTLLEITFVVAVVLAFLYWRKPVQPNQPNRSMGRYQLHVDPTEFDRQIIFDTQTGEAWRRSPGHTDWDKLQVNPLAAEEK